MSSKKTPLGFGSWPSPITTKLVLGSAISLPSLHVNPHTKELLWTEGRPEEGGRQALVSRVAGAAGGEQSEVIPFREEGGGWNARSRVHEYGGGESAWVGEGRVAFSDVKGGLFVVEKTGEGWGAPSQVSPESEVLRYADFSPVPGQAELLISVVEDHTNDEPSKVVNSIQLLDTATHTLYPVQTGKDFYSSPRFSASGNYLCWISWEHPDMPWEGTELYFAEVARDSSGKVDPSNLLKPGTTKKVAGAPGGKEVASQPRWSPSGEDLVFLSDRTGWLELYEYAVEGDQQVKMLVHPPTKSDAAGRPDWAFGISTHAPLNSNAWIATAEGGQLRVIDLVSRFSYTIPTPFVSIAALEVVDGSTVAVIANPATEPARLSLLKLDFEHHGASEQIIKATSEAQVDPEFISRSQRIAFPTSSGTKIGHALFYPPASKDHTGLEGELPPLVVALHGGPTGSATEGLSWNTQWFTSRGFAFVDVDYLGSSGYGKPYRAALDGGWGVVDVESTIDAVEYLTKTGKVDPKRVAISGGSAGGFTVLAALVASKVFAAGVSRYGISDLLLLAGDTHKFESQYMYKLVGGTPESAPDKYHDRSPINHCEKITANLLILQGDQDKVVPPAQSELMAKKIKEAGGKAEIVMYKGEAHGFRGASAKRDAMERELKHYWTTFGIEGAELE